MFLNFIHHFWPALLKQNFVEEFITPIVKVSRKVGSKKEEKAFFTIPEYEQWKQSLENDKEGASKWKIKYYKGLGTNTTEEGKEYFRDLYKHQIQFKWVGEEDGELINMAFSKDKVEERKKWLSAYYDARHEPQTNDGAAVQRGGDVFVDHSLKEVSYTDFVNKASPILILPLIS